jgi:D-arabinose 1-dehydrogenase-like Zn-dependent alcohol dehydrogenase
VIAITHQEDKRELAISLGADHACLLHDGIADEISSLGGIDLLLDTSSAPSNINLLLDCMNEEGRVVIMGISDEPIQAYPLQVILKQISIIGSRPNKRSDLVDILNLAAEGRVKPMIEVYPLSEIVHVVEKLQQGAIRFRAVITFS